MLVDVATKLPMPNPMKTVPSQIETALKLTVKIKTTAAMVEMIVHPARRTLGLTLWERKIDVSLAVAAEAQNTDTRSLPEPGAKLQFVY